MFWSSEKIFLDGDRYFDQLIKDIDNSRQYITVEMYIFNDDLLGDKVADHLIKAFKRGVKVQIIVDGVGSFGFFGRLHRIFNEVGINVKMFNPLPFYHPFQGKLSFLRKWRVLLSRIYKLNRRNHRKIITIDYEIMYAGSFNITAEHTSYYAEKPWKDMGVRVTGENVKFAVLNFKKIWKLRDYYRYKKLLKNIKLGDWRHSPLRLNQTIYMNRHYYKNFLNRVNQSQTRIWLMTPYFIPKRRLIRLLGKAAKRGVDVRLLISQKTDVQFFYWLQYFYFAYLIKKGVKVFQYGDSILHAKNFIIDNYMTIGSTNLNHRSFMHDLEVDLAIQDEDNKRLIAEHFLSSTKPQEMITLEHLKLRPWWDKVLSRLIFLFKYWF